MPSSRTLTIHSRLDLFHFSLVVFVGFPISLYFVPEVQFFVYLLVENVKENLEYFGAYCSEYIFLAAVDIMP